MAEIEPVESHDTGVSGWTVLAVVVVILVLVAVPVWYLIDNLLTS